MPGERISIPGTMTPDRAADAADSDVSSVSDDAEQQQQQQEEEEEMADAAESDNSLDSCDFVPSLDPNCVQQQQQSHESKNKDGCRSRRRRRSQSPESQLRRARSLALKFAADGRPNNSLRQCVRATALSVLAFGPAHHDFAKAYADLAKAYLELKGHNYAMQAAEHAEHAKNILLNLQPPESEHERAEFLRVSLNVFHTLGRSQSLLKRHNEAEQSLLKAEKLLTELTRLSCVAFEEQQELRMRVFTALAKISSRQQKPAVSVSYFEQAMDACESRYGRDSEQMVPLLHGIADVEQSRQEYANHERAIEMCSRAHEIATAISAGEFTSLTACTARTLATAYGLSRDGEVSAESYLQESLSALLHLHGPEHPSVCEVKEELGKLMVRSNRQQEGARLIRETLRLKAGIFGEFSQEVLNSYRLLGSLALSQGRLEKALTDLQKAKDIGDVLMGQSSRICRDLAATIDNILKHPSMEGKRAGYEMQNRPRFNGIVGRGSKQQQQQQQQHATTSGGVFH